MTEFPDGLPDRILDALRDLLCDVCLYKVESAGELDPCDRCEEKIVRYLANLADELEAQVEELDEQIRDLEDSES